MSVFTFTVKMLGHLAALLRQPRIWRKNFQAGCWMLQSARTQWSEARSEQQLKECVPLSKCSSQIFRQWPSTRSSIRLATLYWRTQVACPITIRLPSGGNPGSGPFHSQCLESLYSHFPGLVVMTPATVEDAYTMLLEAVEIDDPVIFCEHKYLYNRLKSDVLPETGLPYDTARVARFGRDVTIVAYSAMVHEARRRRPVAQGRYRSRSGRPAVCQTARP